MYGNLSRLTLTYDAVCSNPDHVRQLKVLVVK